MKNKKTNAPKNNLQEQNIKTSLTATTLENRGVIYISGDEFLNADEKMNLIKEIDMTIGKYTDKCYGIHLIFVNSK